MGHKRIQWLDFARGLSIFFVVFGHSLSTIYSTKQVNSTYFNFLMSILFTFMMPCFFAISGYLYKPIRSLHGYGLMFYKKVISLGFPYVLFSIVYVFMQNLGGSSVNHSHSLTSIFHIYTTPIAYLWFLYALFFMFLIIGIFDLFNINKYIQFILCLGLMVMSIIWPKLFWPGITNTFNNIIYFYFGYLLASSTSGNCNISILRLIKSKKITVSLIILFIILLIIQSFFTIGNSTNGSTFSDFLTKLISILLLIQFSSIIPQDRLFNYFDKYGKVTLIIYLVHAPVMSIMRALSFKIIPINSISVIPLSLVLIVIVWYISIFACYLAKKFTIINFIFYPRKQYISKLVLKTKWGRKLLEN